MKKSLRSLKRLFSYLAPYRMRITVAIFLTFVTAVMNALTPYVSGLPTSEIQRNVMAGEALNFPYIFKTLMLFLVLSLVSILTQLMSGFTMTTAVQSSMKDLRRDISRKMNR